MISQLKSVTHFGVRSLQSPNIEGSDPVAPFAYPHTHSLRYYQEASMDIPVQIALPDLWSGTFERTTWGHLNYLIGPNGTGKSRFAEMLRQHCEASGLSVRYLNAERLVGMEKTEYSYFANRSPLHRGLDFSQFTHYKQYGKQFGLSSDAWVILKENLDLRIRIEAILSDIFNRTLRLVEQGGFLVPKIQTKGSSSEYDLRQAECHGLKEIISILTFIYHKDNNCLILDEPELHLHPQFQQFCLSEMRRLAGDPKQGGKVFFIITHSPYLIDIRTISELKNITLFVPGSMPKYVSNLEENDEYKLARLLPRINTHHKQFFFATRPIFLEGYFDQQLMSLIQEKRNVRLGASGNSLIDVGGKEEVDLLYRLSRILGQEPAAIVDLDAILKGKLRQTASREEGCRRFLQTEGLSIDLMNSIGDTLSNLDRIAAAVLASNSESISALRENLKTNPDIEKRRYSVLVEIQKNSNNISESVPEIAEICALEYGRVRKILLALENAGIFVLPKGELENYLPSYEGSPYSVNDSAKQNTFTQERDYIIASSVPEIEDRYSELIPILDKACNESSVNLEEHLALALADWIHDVQYAVRAGSVTDLTSLQASGRTKWDQYKDILNILEFTMSGGAAFRCRIKLHPSLDPMARELTFTEETVPAKFSLRQVALT